MAGRVVVITGGTSGVGRATARRFAADGDAVAVLARGRDGLAGTAREIELLGGRALPIAVDVAEPHQVLAAAEQIERALGPIDVWINNATTTVFGRVTELTAAEYRRVTDVTYHGVVWGTQAALAAMRPRDRGVIVQVGSAVAHRAIPLQAAYCGAKHAIRAFTDALRSELLHDRVGVKLCMVQLPAINTPLFRHCENKIGLAPQPVPPIFQPEIAADAIHFAARHPRREILVGAPVIGAVAAQALAPGLVDRYLARRGVRGQIAGWRARRGPSNLFAPVPGDHGAHGDFELQARARDPVATIAAWIGAAGVRIALLALVAGGAALLAHSRRSAVDLVKRR